MWKHERQERLELHAEALANTDTAAVPAGPPRTTNDEPKATKGA